MKKLAALIASFTLVLLLASCGGEEQQELKQWMRDTAKNLKGKVPPLPAVKPYEPVTYAANELPDPFKLTKIEPERGASVAHVVGIKGPDLDRKKEPLEAFPLESLKMVGTLQQDKVTYGLIRADNNLYRVKPGNYLGTNFGKISDISETEVAIKEFVQDAGGDWTERTSTLQLSEEASKK
jgi:type IV pilus assembly protein PilP